MGLHSHVLWRSQPRAAKYINCFVISTTRTGKAKESLVKMHKPKKYIDIRTFVQLVFGEVHVLSGHERWQSIVCDLKVRQFQKISEEIKVGPG